VVKKNNKKICIKCNKEYTKNNFYSTSMTYFFEDGKIPICKNCVSQIIEEHGFNAFQGLMKLINKPIFQKLFKGDYGVYIRQINSLPNYKNNTYEDSDLFEEVKRNSPKLINKIPVNVDEEIINYWGKGLLEEDYEILENEMMKLLASFECPDYGMEMIMKDICFINLEIEKIRQGRVQGSQKDIADLIETRRKLMNDAKMKPIQVAESESSDQITFGTLIKKWENERPIPKPLDDEMKEYIDTFMVGHLALMEGLNNEFTEKYKKALSKYTIEFEEVKNNQINEEDDE